MIKRRDFLVGSAAVAGSTLVGFGAGTALAEALAAPPIIQEYMCIVFKDLPLAPYGNGIPDVVLTLMQDIGFDGPSMMRVHPMIVYSEDIREHYSIWDTGDIIERTFTYTGTFVVATGVADIRDVFLNGEHAPYEHYYIVKDEPLSAVVEGIRA